MELQRFLEVLPKIATQPLAILAYLCLIGVWVIWLLRKARSANFVDTLNALPNNRRAGFVEKAGYRYDELAQLSDKERMRFLTRRYLLFAYIITLIAIVLIILAIINTLSSAENNPAVLPNQQSIQGSPGSIQAGRDVNIGNPAIEADIKELLRRTERPIYEKLRARFSRGYALLYANTAQKMIYEVRGHSEEINWSTLALVKLSDTEIRIRGPEIRGAGFTDAGMNSQRIVGAISTFDSETPQGTFQMVFAVLATTSDGAVAVVGACASQIPGCPLNGS